MCAQSQGERCGLHPPRTTQGLRPSSGFSSVNDSWQGRGRAPVSCLPYKLPPLQCNIVIVWLFATSWTAANQAPLYFTISWNLLKFISIESVMLSNHLILCHPLLLLPSVFSSIRIFYVLAKWNFSYKIASSQFWFFLYSLDYKNLQFFNKTPKVVIIKRHITPKIPEINLHGVVWKPIEKER